MDIANYIDHTLLKSDATTEQIRVLCEEARQYSFASVCTNSVFTSFVAEQLRGSEVKTCAVVGFPLGAMATKAKALETKTAVEDGAEEIDMVLAIGLLKQGEDEKVRSDIEAVVREAHPKASVKVIIEACLLTDEEKERACRLSLEAGADYVKTSTGFSTGGASLEDVRLMKKTVGEKMKVKASGGIRTLRSALDFIEAGADRIGTSNGVQIVEEAK
ncbi:deoxyribose-phosphate aldolase [Filifactor villosus]|uniref:Deoxyribose-phosphate aldolase n=1 Tax=Filifactor villosus TaxID=29374 RepID=A0ABV9QP10_9FIRM